MSGDVDIASLPFCYLTTTGRVTGRSHRIEIWFALHGDAVFVLAGDRDRSDWVRNLSVTPDVVLEIGRIRRLTRARVVDPDTDEDALARRLLLEKYGGGEETLEGWARSSLPITIAWPKV